MVIDISGSVIPFRDGAVDSALAFWVEGAEFEPRSAQVAFTADHRGHAAWFLVTDPWATYVTSDSNVTYGKKLHHIPYP